MAFCLPTIGDATLGERVLPITWRRVAVSGSVPMIWVGNGGSRAFGQRLIKFVGDEFRGFLEWPPALLDARWLISSRKLPRGRAMPFACERAPWQRGDLLALGCARSLVGRGSILPRHVGGMRQSGREEALPIGPVVKLLSAPRHLFAAGTRSVGRSGRRVRICIADRDR